MVPIAALPSAANRVRAYRLSHPAASENEIARALGLKGAQVKNALRVGDRRRPKSVAPS